MKRVCLAGFVALLASTILGPAPAHADEGMWLISNPPREILASRYGFTPTDEWLEHMQKSCVRLSTGGSGSIVSASGLVMTNHHVAAPSLYDLSTTGRNLLRDGFYAETLTDEIPIKDLNADVLWDIEDVTARVLNAGKGLDAASAGAARRAEIAAIESESQTRTGLHSEVVTLYNGARYHLYRYRRYTDIRLVFTPDIQAANFGGDADNFEFPRYNLDVALMRIYDQGVPLKADDYLAWSRTGVNDGDLTFVFGNPGSTERLDTVDHLRFLRDVQLPQKLDWAWRLQAKLQELSGRTPENGRIAEDLLLDVENARKAWTGELAALMDPATIDTKQRDQQRLLDEITKIDAAKRAEVDDAIAAVTQSFDTYRTFYAREQALRIRGTLFDHALNLVRLATELGKPNGERLAEYRDSNLAEVRQTLFADAPLYENYEIALIASGLGRMAEVLGRDDPTVAAVLGEMSPTDRAIAAVKGTALFDAKSRKRLSELDPNLLFSRHDPMIDLARSLDDESRRLRTLKENEVDSVQERAYETIASAWFAVDGDRVYPDATFTFRMAFGPVKGYTEPDGQAIPAFTTFGGMFDRSKLWKDAPPFDIPARWAARREAIDPETPFNFVCTADITGGNSGSPVVDRAGNVVGLIFDGNIESLAIDILYTEERARAIAVDTRAIIDALRSIYGADRIVSELLGG